MTAVATQPACPTCGSAILDQRVTKTKPNQPDYKCGNRACDWAIWPPKGAQAKALPRPVAAQQPVEYGHLPGVPMASEAQPAPVAAPVVDPSERLNKLANLQAACFKRALVLADQASSKGYVITLEGVSALTAQLFIAFKEGR